MTVADEYRAKALLLRAQAEGQPDGPHKEELAALAAAYMRLAEQAERNSLTDIVYEPPLRPDEERQD